MNPRSADPMRIDGIELPELIAAIVRSATYHRDLSNAYHAKSEAAWKECDSVAGGAYIRAAGRERFLMLTVARPLRQAIAARTRLENATAQRRVKAGAAFLRPSCAGETCTDCERPLFHHIRAHVAASGPVVLCPFGREYWTLARLLQGFLIGRPGYAALSTIGIIAKR